MSLLADDFKELVGKLADILSIIVLALSTWLLVKVTDLSRDMAVYGERWATVTSIHSKVEGLAADIQELEIQMRLTTQELQNGGKLKEVQDNHQDSRLKQAEDRLVNQSERLLTLEEKVLREGGKK